MRHYLIVEWVEKVSLRMGHLHRDLKKLRNRAGESPGGGQEKGSARGSLPANCLSHLLIVVTLTF